MANEISGEPIEKAVSVDRAQEQEEIEGSESGLDIDLDWLYDELFARELGLL